MRPHMRLAKWRVIRSKTLLKCAKVRGGHPQKHFLRVLYAFFPYYEQPELFTQLSKFRLGHIFIVAITVNLELLGIAKTVIMLVSLVSLLLFLCALILAAPSRPNLHSPSKPLSKRYQIQCFQQTPQHPLCPAVPTDCMRAIQQMRAVDKVDAPMEFSRVTGYTLPHQVVHGTCKIIFDVIANGDPSETTTMYEISARALELIARCVIDRRHPQLGGRTTAGPNDMIHIGVLGEQTSEERPTRLNPMAIVNQCLSP